MLLSNLFSVLHGKHLTEYKTDKEYQTIGQEKEKSSTNNTQNAVWILLTYNKGMLYFMDNVNLHKPTDSSILSFS